MCANSKQTCNKKKAEKKTETNNKYHLKFCWIASEAVKLVLVCICVVFIKMCIKFHISPDPNYIKWVFSHCIGLFARTCFVQNEKFGNIWFSIGTIFPLQSVCDRLAQKLYSSNETNSIINWRRSALHTW